MINDNIKIRKEKFGWLICNINDCNIYEISEIGVFIVQLLKNNQEGVKRIDLLAEKVKDRFNLNMKDSKKEVKLILNELKKVGLI
jgi:hypothetical protein